MGPPSSEEDASEIISTISVFPINCRLIEKSVSYKLFDHFYVFFSILLDV